MLASSQSTDLASVKQFPRLKSMPVVTTPHMGMRGLLSMHVLLYHMSMFTDDWWFRIFAGTVVSSTQMPFFFLLSGFVLAIGSGQTYWALFRLRGWDLGWNFMGVCNVRGGEETELQQLPYFNAGRFYWKRFSRIMPAYWLCNLICVPLVYLKVDFWNGMDSSTLNAHDNDVFAYSMLVLGTFTWFVPLHGIPGLRWTKLMWPLNGPSWFVSTIVFCYAAFPCVLPALQRLRKSEQRQVAVWGCYAAQLAVLAAMFAPLSWRYGAEDAFFAATCWPVTRFPVFVMGVLAGLQRCTATRSIRFGGMGALLGLTPQGDQEEDSNNWWAQAVDTEMLLALLSCCSLYIISRCVPNSEFYFTFFIVALSPLVQLTLVYGLTFDLKCKSYTARFFCSWPMQWWGRISYAVLLIQMPVIGYMTVATNWRHNADCVEWTNFTNTSNTTGASDFATGKTCSETEFKWEVNGNRFPVWAVPIGVFFVALFAWAMTELFEKPVNRWLLSYLEEDISRADFHESAPKPPETMIRFGATDDEFRHPPERSVLP